jgi:hypothetical protein
MNGRHAKQSVWVLVQQYNTVVKEFRLQTEWVILFHCKDRHSFSDALDENDIVPSRRERRYTLDIGVDEALEATIEHRAAVIL